MLRHQGDDVVFRLREADLPAVDKNLPAVVIDNKAARPEAAARQHAGHALPAAAQHGAHARQQLPVAERLRNVVVRAEIERGDLVPLGDSRGEHDDRRDALFADRPDKLHAVPVRKAEIQNDKVRYVGKKRRNARRAGPRLDDLIAVRIQQRLDEAADVRIVLHEQDLEFIVAHASRPPSPAKSGTSCRGPACFPRGSPRRAPE